jgi:hypothetical protein
VTFANLAAAACASAAFANRSCSLSDVILPPPTVKADAHRSACRRDTTLNVFGVNRSSYTRFSRFRSTYRLTDDATLADVQRDILPTESQERGSPGGGTGASRTGGGAGERPWVSANRPIIRAPRRLVAAVGGGACRGRYRAAMPHQIRRNHRGYCAYSVCDPVRLATSAPLAAGVRRGADLARGLGSRASFAGIAPIR